MALVGYGVGLLGLVAIKVLAPGYYARQDIKTPVRIAVMVLVLTQVLNVMLVPWLAHAGLALSIALGAMVNAGWLLVGLIRRGTYMPKPGWGMFILQVVAGSALLAVGLMVCAQQLDWIAMVSNKWQRAGWLVAVVVGAAVVYLGALLAAGLPWRSLLRRAG